MAIGTVPSTLPHPPPPHPTSPHHVEQVQRYSELCVWQQTLVKPAAGGGSNYLVRQFMDLGFDRNMEPNTVALVASHGSWVMQRVHWKNTYTRCQMPRVLEPSNCLLSSDSTWPRMQPKPSLFHFIVSALLNFCRPTHHHVPSNLLQTHLHWRSRYTFLPAPPPKKIIIINK